MFIANRTCRTRSVGVTEISSYELYRRYPITDTAGLLQLKIWTTQARFCSIKLP
jgi:hypothetical protein